MSRKIFQSAHDHLMTALFYEAAEEPDCQKEHLQQAADCIQKILRGKGKYAKRARALLPLIEAQLSAPDKHQRIDT